MRILILTTDFKPRTGGVAELGYRVARGLAELGHHVTVVANDVETDDPALADEPFSLRRVFPRRPPRSARTPGGMWRVLRWTWRARRAIDAAIRETRADVVMTGNFNPLWCGLLDGSHLPYAVYLHGEDLASGIYTRLFWRKRRMKRLLRGAGWVFCNSSYTLSLLEAMIGGTDRASVTGCGVDVGQIVEGAGRAEARSRLGWDDSPVLLTVARVVMRKGIDTTLRAIPAVLEQSPACRYAVIGDGPDRRRLEELAAELGLKDRTMFMGYVDEAVRRDAYLAADLYVMPSRPGDEGEVEGFGISFLEANAHGLAVVGSRAGGIPDAVENEVNGLLVAPDDPGELAGAIRTLLADPSRRAEMAARGKDRIRTRFNWSAISRHIAERLEGVARRRGAGR
jgi:phosphatidylinositol alpha-1,6-mannosyltransferase